MKNVLITGGAGFIGSHLSRRLLADTSIERVTIFDNFSSGTWGRIPARSSRLEIIEADLRHAHLVKSAAEGCDTVFHLAANPDISKAVTDPSIDFWQGTYLLQNTLEAARVNGVEGFVYLSGSGVYGERAGTELTENSGPMHPISTYGASKLACEAMISSYSAMFGMRAVCLRPANIVGPRQTHGVGYDFIRKLIADPTRLEVLGDGSQLKSYLWVDDLIDAMIGVAGWSAIGLCPLFSVFNVTNDDQISVADIAKIAVMLNGHPECMIKYGNLSRGWVGDVPSIKMNADNLRLLGWRPTKTSRQAITDSIAALMEEIS